MTDDSSKWPFDSPPNVACFTVRSVVEGTKPVLMVSRDADDGAWQFLTGDAFDMADARLVSLRDMVELDSTLLQIADVPSGWMSWRERRGAPWTRQAEAQQTSD
jgi:hypothetical protein